MTHLSDAKQIQPDTASAKAHLLAILAFTAAGAIWLWVKGPMPVVQGTVPLDIDVPFAYMLSAFPFLGILTADVLVSLWLRANRGAAVVLAAQLGSITLIAAARLSHRIPISGHILLLTFFVMRSRNMMRRDATRRTETWVGLLVLLVLVGIKAVAWHDLVTVGWAVALATMIWLGGVVIRHGADLRLRRPGASQGKSRI